jgi:hypothetical protein
MCQFFHIKVELICMDTLADADERTMISKLQFCHAWSGDLEMTKLTSAVHAVFIPMLFNVEV